MVRKSRKRNFGFAIGISLICLLTVVFAQPTAAGSADYDWSGSALRFNPNAVEKSGEVVPETLEELRNSNAADIAALSSYDSRKYGLVTPVKDQGSSDLCWAYASISASEVSILKSGIDGSATKDNLSLSPEALGYARYNRPKDPLGNTKAVVDPAGSNWYNSAGNARYGAAMMSQWCGPIGKSQPANVDPFANALFRLDNAVQITGKTIEDVKLAIAEYGAVTFSYNNVRETEYYNPAKEGGTASYPHACTLIGWDDDIPAQNFRPNGANRNGGWLVKNSYNSLPYFWLSYDNSSDSVYAFDFTAKNTYENNYFYDYDLTDHLNYSLKVKKACEMFEAKKSTADKTEYLEAVNVGFIGKNVTVKAEIYVDMTDETNPYSGTKAGGGEASFKYGGFRTVKLDKSVALTNGKKFACVVGVSNADDSAVICNMLGKNGTPSFVYKDYWQATNNYTPRIKAFTSTERREETEPHVHAFTAVSGKPATCTENGVFAHDHCTVCNKDFIDGIEKTTEELTIAALGHDVVRHEGKPATCTERGYEEYETCSRCDYTTYAEIAALGHNYGEWTVVRQATVEEYGIERRICSNDAMHVETRQLPKRVSQLVASDVGGGKDVVVNSPEGFAYGVELVVIEIAQDDYANYREIADSVSGEIECVYDLKLVKNGVAVQPDGTLTVKLRIREELKDKPFKLFRLHEGRAEKTAYAVEGDYAVVTVDSLSEFIFVKDNAEVSAPEEKPFEPLYIALGVTFSLIALSAAGFVVFKKLRKNQTAEKR